MDFINTKIFYRITKQAGITFCNKMVINDDDEFVLDERNIL